MIKALPRYRSAIQGIRSLTEFLVVWLLRSLTQKLARSHRAPDYTRVTCLFICSANTCLVSTLSLALWNWVCSREQNGRGSDTTVQWQTTGKPASRQESAYVNELYLCGLELKFWRKESWKHEISEIRKSRQRTLSLQCQRRTMMMTLVMLMSAVVPCTKSRRYLYKMFS